MSKQTLFKNIASLSLVQVANYALPFLAVPIISRIIGPDKFGILNYAVAFMAYFNILITYGFDLTATRRIAKDPMNNEQRNKIFSEVIVAKFFLFIVSIGIFVACLFLLPPLRQEKQVAIFSFLVCVGTLFTQNWLFAAMQDLAKVALFDFISKLLFTILVFLIVRERHDYIWQPLITGLVQITIALGSLIWAVKKYELKLKPVGLKQIISLLKKEATVFVSLILISLYTTTNVIILGLFQSSEQVGYYIAGQKLVIVVYSIISLPLSQALFPYIGKAFAENYYQGLELVQKIIPLIFVVTISAGIVMLLAGPKAIELFYGTDFKPAGLVFQVLAFAPVFMTMSSFFGTQIMLNLQMDKAFLIITLTATVISLLINLSLVSKFGYLGTSLNWMATEALIAFIMWAYLRKRGIDPIKGTYFSIQSVSTQLKPIIAKLMPSSW